MLTPPPRPATLPANVYVYQIDVDGVPRYVGAGSGTRAWDHFDLARAGSSVPFHVYLRQLTLPGAVATVHIVSQGLDRNAADILEAALIERHGRLMLGTGTLVNLGDGGRYNGQRMHTARAHHVAGLPNPFVPPKRGRKRPPPGSRKIADVIHRGKFGSKKEA